MKKEHEVWHHKRALLERRHASSANHAYRTPLLLQSPHHLPLPRTPRVGVDAQYRADPRLIRLPVDAIHVLIGATHGGDGCVCGDAQAGGAGARRGAGGVAAPCLFEDHGVGAVAVIGCHGSPEGGAVGVVDGGKSPHVDRVGGAEWSGKARRRRRRRQCRAVQAERAGDVVVVRRGAGGRVCRAGRRRAGRRHGPAEARGRHEWGGMGVRIVKRGGVAAGCRRGRGAVYKGERHGGRLGQDRGQTRGVAVRPAG